MSSPSTPRPRATPAAGTERAPRLPAAARQMSVDTQRMGGVIAFTDGAAKGNPGPGGWGAIIATPDGRVTELGGAAPHTTNNQMELTAVIEVLRHLRATPGAIALHADSTYVIRGITEWIDAWRGRGWKTAQGQPVLNRALWEQLAALAAERADAPVAWHYVRGHAAIPGNERADAIAVAFASGQRPALYDGALTGYPVAIHDLPADTALPASQRMRPHVAHRPAYSYLSLVNGRPMRHGTWADCERRVKGVAGARFKKAMSADQEAAILAAWGLPLDGLERG
jgi:ribonuclease HI